MRGSLSKAQLLGRAMLCNFGDLASNFPKSPSEAILAAHRTSGDLSSSFAKLNEGAERAGRSISALDYKLRLWRPENGWVEKGERRGLSGDCRAVG